MYIIIALVLLLVLATILVLQKDSFGASPSGERLERIKRSPNYRDGKFQNLSPTPSLTEGHSYAGVLYNFFIRKKEGLVPLKELPWVSTDLKSLPADQDLLVWFGHSSYLLQLEGKTFLIDPVLSGYASPFHGMNKAFRGADTYKIENLPPIDYLLITHDHYDHLDHETILKLKGKVGKVICALGVGAHFEKWGYPASRLIEKDWGDRVDFDNGLRLHFTPARHFSGRGLTRNNTLWTSYVIESPIRKIFVGGDSGYDTHFARIGEEFGGFDLAILENGQYNEAWRYIHTLPEEVLKAGRDLKARRNFPVHSSKFDLGGHAWNEPLNRVTKLNRQYNQALITPRIGEVVRLDDEKQVFQEWWKGI